MTAQQIPDQAGSLIGGVYAVDVTRPLPAAGGGLPAFAAIDRRSGRGGLMAVQALPGAPPRAAALAAMGGWEDPGLLAPLAHGPTRGPQGEVAWFVVSAAPTGPSLAADPRPWSEAELLDCVLRPAAAVLAGLANRRVTHRAIRLDNVFQAGAGTPVVLGSAWAGPPAMRQPALFEPAYAAMCLASGRGDGGIADDVYSLGVLLVVLALGRAPLSGLAPDAIVRRKLALGSHAALVGSERLPPAIADLVGGMLAEDPDHRPAPALLADPAAARARRVAARPPRRGQRPLDLPGGAVWDVRTLAHAIATDPEDGVRLLRGGTVDRWLRRNLADSTMALRLEEVVRLRGQDGPADDSLADGLLAMRAVAALDPLAPLCWRGVALWPDGLGPALAAAAAESATTGALLTERLGEIVTSEAASHWAAMRPDRGDPTLLRLEARQRRAVLLLRGWGGGLPRLRYALSPLLPCASPVLAGVHAARLQDLLPALELAAARPERSGMQPVDRETAAFIAARQDASGQLGLGGLVGAKSSGQAVLLQLRVLAGLQARLDCGPLPALAAWLAEQAAPELSAWRNRARREALERALAETARSGQLPQMAALLENASARVADARGFQAAGEAVRRIDAELADLAAAAPQRAETARRIGHEVALGAAMMAATVAAVALVLV